VLNTPQGQSCSFSSIQYNVIIPLNTLWVICPHNEITISNMWVILGIVVKATIQFKDISRRRIILPKEIIEVENLNEGDYIEIDVKKIEKKSVSHEA
jgi:hypothetical protein